MSGDEGTFKAFLSSRLAVLEAEILEHYARDACGSGSRASEEERHEKEASEDAEAEGLRSTRMASVNWHSSFASQSSKGRVATARLPGMTHFEADACWKDFLSNTHTEDRPSRIRKNKGNSLRYMATRSIVSHGGPEGTGSLEPEASSRSCLRRLMIHPEARGRLVWVCIGALLVFYDMVVLPLQLAELVSNSPEVTVVQWISLFFWIFDVPLNFVTGFFGDGHVIMNQDLVARAYLRGWFATDLLTIALDIMTVAVTALQEGMDEGSARTSLVRFTRASRIARFMRLVRFMRIRRILEVGARLVDNCTTELSSLVARILGLLVAILMLNHFIACIWYAIGTSERSRERLTWLGEGELSPELAYFCAFHWALTQFTPATNNIAPVTALERFFASCVVLVALITFSTFLGRMTSTMSQLLNLNSKQFQQESALRSFIRENRITSSMAQHLWALFKQRKHQAKRGTRPTLREIGEIVLFPAEIHEALVLEICAKHLLALPIFRLAFESYPEEELEVCKLFDECSSGASSQIFEAGAAAECARCIVSGQTIYDCPIAQESGIKVGPNEWMSEAALWGTWEHAGTLRARRAVAWLELRGDTFREAVRSFATERTLRTLCAYAALFAAEAELLPLIDLPRLIDSLGLSAASAGDRADGGRRSVVSVGSTGSAWRGQDAERKRPWGTAMAEEALSQADRAAAALAVSLRATKCERGEQALMTSGEGEDEEAEEESAFSGAISESFESDGSHAVQDEGPLAQKPSDTASRK